MAGLGLHGDSGGAQLVGADRRIDADLGALPLERFGERVAVDWVAAGGRGHDVEVHPRVADDRSLVLLLDLPAQYTVVSSSWRERADLFVFGLVRRF